MMFLVVGLLLFVNSALAGDFIVDWENDRFLKDGETFQYVAAGMHYFRIPYEYWSNRIYAAKSAGCNVVQTYVAWNAHEPSPGVYDFSGNYNLIGFIEEVQKQDMTMILRVGPYICAEWNLGGLPPWLLGIPGMQVRTSNSDYLAAVNSWLKKLLPKIKPYLYKNGGPIIMVQIENEYGSFGCDHEYMDTMYAMFHDILQDDVVYFTTDGPGGVKCGSYENTKVLTTIDFGVGGDPAAKFENLKKFQPHGPNVNSEFYTGWLDHWKSKHAHHDAAPLGESLDDLLAINASVNFYMWHGGTNFGLTSGAQKNFLKADPTSYDYGAPQSEWGDIKPDKYWAIRKVTDKYFPGNKLPVPQNFTRLSPRTIQIDGVVHVRDQLIRKNHITDSVYPKTMEELGVFEGIVAYQHKFEDPVHGDITDIVLLGVHDRAYVTINQQKYVKIVKRDEKVVITLHDYPISSIEIYVENMGYIGYGKCMIDPLVAYKGLLNVTLSGEIITNWSHYRINIIHSGQYENIKPLYNIDTASDITERVLLGQGPTTYKGVLHLQGEELMDTFVDTTGWGKGYLVINGQIIGRYWPDAGPQYTLYVPKSYLVEGENIVQMMELQFEPQTNNILKLTNVPVIDGPWNPDA